VVSLVVMVIVVIEMMVVRVPVVVERVPVVVEQPLVVVGWVDQVLEAVRVVCCRLQYSSR